MTGGLKSLVGEQSRFGDSGIIFTALVRSKKFFELFEVNVFTNFEGSFGPGSQCAGHCVFCSNFEKASCWQRVREERSKASPGAGTLSLGGSPGGVKINGTYESKRGIYSSLLGELCCVVGKVTLEGESKQRFDFGFGGGEELGSLREGRGRCPCHQLIAEQSTSGPEFKAGRIPSRCCSHTEAARCLGIGAPRFVEETVEREEGENCQERRHMDSRCGRNIASTCWYKVYSHSECVREAEELYRKFSCEDDEESRRMQRVETTAQRGKCDTLRRSDDSEGHHEIGSANGRERNDSWCLQRDHGGWTFHGCQKGGRRRKYCAEAGTVQDVLYITCILEM